MKLYHLVLSLFIPCMLLACDRQNEEHDIAVQDTDNITHGKLLATIDGRKIYEEELQSLLVDMFGEHRAQTMDEVGRKRALESLIASHALSKEAAKELEPEAILDIDMRTKRYKENLLINSYMKTKIDPDSVSNEHIRTYYEDNLEKFGKSTIKQYRLLTTQDKLPEESRDNYLSLVSSARETGDLIKISEVLKANGYDIQLQNSELNKELLDNQLYQFINIQNINTLSELIFINNKPYLVKVVSEKVTVAKPLAQVRDTIRKNLILNELRNAVKQQSEISLANSKVVYAE